MAYSTDNMVMYLQNENLVFKRSIIIKLYTAYNAAFDISICSCRVNLALGRVQYCILCH